MVAEGLKARGVKVFYDEDEKVTLWGKDLGEFFDRIYRKAADALGVSQARVSSIERQSDLYLSTLKTYIGMLGGELELVAVFPDEHVKIDVLGDTADVAPA